VSEMSSESSPTVLPTDSPESVHVVTLDPRTGLPFDYPASNPPPPPTLGIRIGDRVGLADGVGG